MVVSSQTRIRSKLIEILKHKPCEAVVYESLHVRDRFIFEECNSYIIIAGVVRVEASNIRGRLIELFKSLREKSLKKRGVIKRVVHIKI